MMRLFLAGVVFGAVACGPGRPPEGDTDGSSSAATTGGETITGAPPTTGGGPTTLPPDPSSTTAGTLTTIDPTTTSPEPSTSTTGTTMETTSTTSSTGTTTETTSTTSSTGSTTERESTSTTGGRACDDCPEGQVCAAGTCVALEVLPACPVEPVVSSHWPAPHPPTSLVVTDLDGDGDLDVVAGSPAVSVIEVLLNTGQGEFVAGEMVGLIAPTASIHLAVGPVDGEGEALLAAAQQIGGDVTVLQQQGGALAVHAQLDADTRRVHFADADIDGASGGDLVTIGATSPTVRTWLGDGLGGFTPGATFDVPLSFGASVIDVDGDVLSDLVGPVEFDDFRRVRVMARIDGGGFTEIAALAAVGTPIVQALAGPLDDGPGREIVAVTEHLGSGLVAVWSSDVPGQWAAVPRLVRTVPGLTGGLLADVDGDSLIDLVATTEAAMLVVLRGDGDGGFACERTLELEAPALSGLVAVGDADGDGRAEIFAGSLDLHEIQVIATP